MWKILFTLCAFVTLVISRPQGPDERPEPYEYQYEVKDPEQNLFFDKNEIGDAAGKVTGQYSVLLPDNRLMTVSYSVDGESGFVPKISFQDNANPFSG
ncbi:pro-resilin-like [Lutzomyia longipalpis]|uniref:Putative cuticle protein 19 n=1 Tax=Lutzomyia longipalpis TaxID=7200 RepID=A0A7G3AHZ4_LUTLO|nr:pro-resilin-like [Lutzomyia longipalpis]